MSQLFLVLLQLLLLLGQIAIGADLSPFDPDAKNFSCCNDHTMDLWDPICPRNKQVKCGKGKSCRLDVQLRNGPATSSRQISHIFMGKQKSSNTPCHHRYQTQSYCQKIDDYLFLCDCGRDDNFVGNCNPLGLLNQMRKQFCPVPSSQKSTPTDLDCLYNQSDTQESTTSSITVGTTVISGLSDGEIVGIVIGIVAFVAVVIAIIFRLCRRSNVAATPQPSQVEDRTVQVIAAEEIRLDNVTEADNHDINERRNHSNLLSEIMLSLEQVDSQ